MMPTTVPAGAPMTAVVVPVVGPVGALVPTVTEGGPTEGWWRVAAVAPMAMPTGAPAATTTPTTRSREAAAAA
jgi:hypothetical protein